MSRVNIVEWIAKKIRALVGIVEDGDTATHAIAKGKYVIWKGNACKASSAISIGDTLSSSNLTALDDGVGNDLASDVAALTSKFRQISSGSFRDIKEPGVYWLTSSVTDKPNNGAGTYIINKYNNDYLSGIYIVADDAKTYSVKLAGNTWKYEELAVNSNMLKVQNSHVSGTTDSTGNLMILNNVDTKFASFIPDSNSYDGIYIPFRVKSAANWYVKVTNWAFTSQSGVTVSGTVYYIV